MICKVGLRRTVKGTAICGFELRTPIGPCTIVFTATQCIQGYQTGFLQLAKNALNVQMPDPDPTGVGCSAPPPQ